MSVSSNYQPGYRQSWALVVGVDDYEALAPLRHAVADARLVSDILVEHCDFAPDNVALIVDAAATRAGILSAFNRSLADRTSVDPDDRVVMFFAGHGKTRTGRRGEIGYLAPADAQPGEWHTFLSMEELLRQAEFTPAKHILFLLDTCFSGLALTRSAGGTADRLASELLTRPAVQALTAGMADQVVVDGYGPGGRNSLFTGYLAEGLRGAAAGPDGLITATDLFNYVRRRVAGDRRSNQTPDGGNLDGRGDLVFRLPTAGRLPDELLRAVGSRLAGIRHGAAMELARLLQGSDPLKAELARAELQRLRDGDPDADVRATAQRALSPEPTDRGPPGPARRASLALELSVMPQRLGPGDEARWTATLHNTGAADLRQVTVSRRQSLLADPFSLPAGKRRRLTFTTRYPAAGTQSETVAATGVGSSGERVGDEASARVQVLEQRPGARPAAATKPKRRRAAAQDTLRIAAPIRLELVRIPAGEFLMGSDPAKDPHAQDDEQPQHQVQVAAFHIGKYPVTNSQYGTFVKAAGHQAPRHWRRGQPPSRRRTHPVVYVSWDDAVAFCEWLTRETGRAFRLPSEAEWEKAARGTDGRLYPWGDDFDPAILNSKEAGPGETTPVRQYSPAGESPFGVADLAGNVDEWTSTLWGQSWELAAFAYPYNAADGREAQDATQEAYRVLRGGSFVSDRSGVRCAARLRHVAFLRGRLSGFRVVAPIYEET